eukprot:11294749-Karenia_brevis.AAC.1
MIQGIQDESPQEAQVDTGIQAETCSIEVDKARHVGAVERVPYSSRVRSNRWESLTEEDDDEDDECDDTQYPL